jgi:hypothetical protein
MAKKKNPLIVEVIRKCRDLDFVRSEIPGGVVVEIPTEYYFEKGIPEENPEYYREIYKSILNDLCENYGTKKNSRMFFGRFQLWETGSFAKHSGGTHSVDAEEKARRRMERIIAKNKGGGGSDAMFRRLPGSYGTNQ